MDDAALGASIRALRHRRGWRQADLQADAPGSAPAWSACLRPGVRIASRLPALRRVARALDVRLAWDAGFRGSELARLRDADHARATEALIGRLERRGWTAVAEVSFNNYGERGRIDVLAYHPPTRTLLVIEVKTLIVEVQAILGGLSAETANCASRSTFPRLAARSCGAHAGGCRDFDESAPTGQTTSGSSPDSPCAGARRWPGCERRLGRTRGC